MSTQSDLDGRRDELEAAARHAADEAPPKLTCPHCGEQQSRVLRTTPALDEDAIRRRRVCLSCGFRFNTEERISGGR